MFKKSKSDSDNKAGASPTAVVDGFEARRSSRVAAGRYAADNDTWVEALAVCEIPVRPGYGDDGAAAASKKNGGGGLFRKFKSSRKNGAKSDDDGTSPSSAAGDAASSSSSSPRDTDVAAASQRLALRPYFQSRNTGQRVWDEPPSGASEIVYATPEARRMARAQLEEMKSTYAVAAVKRRKEREEKKAAEEAAARPKQGGKNILKAFKRSSSASAADAGPSSSLLGNHGDSGGRAKGSLVLSDEGGRRGIPKSILRESKELAGVDDDFKGSYEQDLQKAMLMSMGVGGGSVMGVGDHRPRGRTSSAPGSVPRSSSASGMTREEEEQLELAKALSMSEQEARQGRSTGRSKSSSRRGGSGRSGGRDGDGAGKGSSGRQRRSRGRDERPYASVDDEKPPSSSPPYAGMKPPPILTEEFDSDFDGGGKVPAKPKHNKNGRPKDGDFGDRGPSWELSWSHSASPTHKDWAFG